MVRYEWGVLSTLTAASLIGAVSVAPPAMAGGVPTWNGAYAVTFNVDQKTGTSVAATQRQSAYTEVYQVASSCASGECVATIVDGPAPSNPTVPEPSLALHSPPATLTPVGSNPSATSART